MPERYNLARLISQIKKTELAAYEIDAFLTNVILVFLACATPPKAGCG